MNTLRRGTAVRASLADARVTLCLAALLCLLALLVPAFTVAVRADSDKAAKTGSQAVTGDVTLPEEEEASGSEDKEITLSPEQAARSGVTVAIAGPGRLHVSVELLGEVRLNADRLARVSPRVPGVVREVKKGLGDAVRAGDVLAVFDSRELALAKAALLAAQERVQLARIAYSHEKDLWEKKISAEQDYLSAKQALGEATIDLRSAEQQLRALGLTDQNLKGLAGGAEGPLTRYEVAAPIDGTIIEKHAVLGESFQVDATTFVVADLGTVWVDFSVPAKELPSIHAGQEVSISASGAPGAAKGTISYLGPVVEQDTRASLARVVLPNDDGAWKPGQFVTGQVECESVNVPVLVPKTALQTIGGEPYVFIQTEDGFKASVVTPGRAGDTALEILHGLEQGQAYAATGTFILKAELAKGKAEEE